MEKIIKAEDEQATGCSVSGRQVEEDEQLKRNTSKR